jgi:predicted amidohydrolase
MAFTVACAQFAPRKAAVAQNLDRIAEIVLQAQDEQIDLLVFPETATSGYFLEGGVLDAALTSNQLLAEISRRLGGRLTRPMDLVLGFYQNADGNLYNSAGYFELGENGIGLIHTYRKFFLPTYGVFDEERFVSRGRDLGVFETRFGRVALMICEDVWHSILPALCAAAGAQMAVVPRAGLHGSKGRESGPLRTVAHRDFRGARHLLRELPIGGIRRRQGLHRGEHGDRPVWETARPGTDAGGAPAQMPGGPRFSDAGAVAVAVDLGLADGVVGRAAHCGRVGFLVDGES